MYPQSGTAPIASKVNPPSQYTPLTPSTSPQLATLEKSGPTFIGHAAKFGKTKAGKAAYSIAGLFVLGVVVYFSGVLKWLPTGRVSV